MSRASTTGVWADVDPREAVSRGATLAEETRDATRPAATSDAGSGHGSLLPFPLMSSPAAGGTRWAADALGLAAQLLPGLPADIGPAGWRLLGGRAATAARTLDSRREQSRLSRAFDALGEYAEASDLPVLVSVPGPWTLVRRLGLPDESPVLGDAGARRDVIQSYAHGLLDLRERIHRVMASGTDEPSDALRRVVVRLVEEDLDPILTGRVPTVSGYRSLPAVPDTHVTAALRSLVARTGPDTILSLPAAATVRIAGKDVPHTQLAQDADIRHLALPLTRSAPSPQHLQAWERLAEWSETGRGVWLRIPPAAASAPEAVTTWVEAIATPWTGVGMSRAGIADFGILTGEELPTGSGPLLSESASAARSRIHVQMAGSIARALTDQAG